MGREGVYCWLSGDDVLTACVKAGGEEGRGACKGGERQVVQVGAQKVQFYKM